MGGAFNQPTTHAPKRNFLALLLAKAIYISCFFSPTPTISHSHILIFSMAALADSETKELFERLR